MRSRLLFASLLALGLLAGSSSPAGGVEHVPGTSGACQDWSVLSPYWQGQTFTETVTGQLNTVRLVIADSSPLGQTPTHDLVVEIRDGSVTGTLLGVSELVETDGNGTNAVGASPFTSPNPNTAYFWYEFSFSVSIEVTAGSVYAIVLRQADPANSWLVSACAMPAGPNNPAYDEGVHSYYLAQTLAWSDDPSTDMPFIIGYDVPTPPSTPVTPAYTG